MDLLISCIFIFLARMSDVSIGTVRTIFIIRGDKKLATITAFFEIAIWFMVARQALSGSEFNIFIALAYSGGYAFGTLVGSIIEEKLALGNLSVQVVIDEDKKEIIDKLRESEFGVSVIDAQGKTSNKLLLMLEINRKDFNEVKRIIYNIDNQAFITVADTKMVINGYFKKKK